MEKTLELLSPAGNFESLKLAVYNGADAVYLGLNKFSARAKADNFSDESLSNSIRFAHLYSVKVYAAVNTLVKQSEIKEFLQLVDVAVNSFADAFIVQSIGMAKMLKQIYPDIVIHASTQMGIHNRYGAKLCKEAGISRVILSRECSLEDIKDIKNNVDIELEAFIHGALCVSFSGGCYMSSFISCTSGNRGQCLQPCRMLYTAYQGIKRLKSGFLLSMSDLCVGNDIQKLTDAGVNSFKIEGRMRRPEYTAVATDYYRKILDGKKITEEDNYNLSAVYNRGGFTKGYYFKDANLISSQIQGHKGVNIGKVTKIEADGTLTVKSVRKLHEKDGFKLVSGGEEKGSAVFNREISKDVYSLKYSGEASTKTDVYITTDSELNYKLAETSFKLPLYIKFTAKLNKAAEINIRYGGNEINMFSDYIVASAEKTIANIDNIREKLEKLGDTVFYAKETTIDIDEDIFIPASVLNNLRRAIIIRLENKMLEKYSTPLTKIDLHSTMHSTMQINNDEKSIEKSKKNNNSAKNISNSNVVCIVNNADILNIYSSFYAVIYKPDNYNGKEFDIFFNKANFAEVICNNLYLYIPPMCNTEDLNIIKTLIIKYNIKGVYINNPFGISFARENNLKIFMGVGMNIFNNIDIEYAESLCNDYVISCELSLNEILDLKTQKNCFVFAYGNILLMTLSHCIIKTIKGSDCSNCGYSENLKLTDRTNSEFFIKRYKISKCYFNILNGKKLNIFKKNIPLNNFLIDLCSVPEETAKTLLNCIKNKCTYDNINTHTGGHMYRCIK